MRTATGGFPIGVRRGWSEWQRDLAGWTAWLAAQGFEVADLGPDGDEAGPVVRAAGLGIGSVDLRDWKGLTSADPGQRRAAVEANAALIRACAPLGVRNYFLVVLPEDPARERAANFADAVAGLAELAPHLEAAGARTAIEGWPGPGALACTPEGVRALIREVPSPAIGLNYDPSHLIRMGIDPIRFVGEFADRVAHVHGKDTELLDEGRYEYGTEQPPTFGRPRGFGGMHWRYTIPGHGVMRWTRAFEILRDAGYAGAVSIELEDDRFNGTEAGEKAGLVAGGAFLASA